MNIDYQLSQDYRLIATQSARISEGNHQADTIRISADESLVSQYTARLEFLLPKHKRVSGKIMNYNSVYGGYTYTLPSQITAVRGIVYPQLVLSGEDKVIKTRTSSSTAIEVVGSVNASIAISNEKSQEFFIQASETLGRMNTTVEDVQNKLITGFFKGEKGDKGDRGERGLQGVQGLKGDKGEQGLRGIQGATGAKGEKGDKGDAFTYSDFTSAQLASLKGAKGDKGEQGIQGEKGEKGDRGIQGVAGMRGDKGAPFVYSDFTSAQLAALKGAKGDKGEQGIQGIKGDKGEKGDAFTYSDFTSAQLASLKGAKGDKGEQGIQGEKGEKGDKGDRGVQGVAGMRGDRGEPFVYADFTSAQLAALKGAKGDKGEQGIQGLKGEKGDKGDQGIQGTAGAKGDKGDIGITPNLGISVTMIEPNEAATVIKSGTTINPAFELKIPKAEGAVLTHEPGSAEDMALSQAGVENYYMRRIETVYSMSGTQEEQHGYPNGLPSGSAISTLNLGRYAFLIIYIKSTYCAGSYMISMREKFDLDYRSSGIAKDYTMVDRYFTSISIINSAKSRFQHHSVVEYENGVPTSKNKNADYVVYRIDGVVA